MASLIGSTEHIRDWLFGPQQHNEHCKNWRWHLHVRDNDARWDAVLVAMRKMYQARREMEQA